ncbi:hypothetical protein IE077_001298, partial [Cardiosporidium cionae]
TLIQCLNQVSNAAAKEKNEFFSLDKRYVKLIDTISVYIVSFSMSDLYNTLIAMTKLQSLSHCLISCNDVFHSSEHGSTTDHEDSIRENNSVLVNSGTNSAMGVFNLRELNFILLGLSNMGYRDLPTLRTIADYLVCILSGENSTQRISYHTYEAETVVGPQLSTIFLSCSTLGLKNPHFFQILTQNLASFLRTLSSSHLINVLIAVATLSQDTDFPLCLSFMQELECTLKEKYARFSREDALTVCWAMCAIGMHRSLPDLILEFASLVFNTEFLNGLNHEQSAQLHQVALTILLEDSQVFKKMQEDLEREGKWNIIYQIPKVPEDPTQIDDEKMEGQLLIAKKQLHNLLSNYTFLKEIFHIMLGESANSLQLANAKIQLDEVLRKFYYVPLSVRVPMKELSSSTCSTQKLEEIDRRTEMKISFIFHCENFFDISMPLDPFLTLKRQHLQKMDWRVILLKLDSFLMMGGDQQRQMQFLRNVVFSNENELHTA